MLESPGQIKEYVGDKEIDLGALFRRQDIDYDVWSLNPHAASVTQYQREIDIKTARHSSELTIISNDPRTFADNVQARLSSADKQIIVRMPESEGEDKREDMAKLERLFHFSFEKADERLRRMMLPPLRDSIIWYACVRGWAGARILVYKHNGKVVFDFIPLDPRWLTPEAGYDGIVRCGYKTFRSLISLQSEYGVEVTKSISAKTNNEVIEFWEEDKSEFYNSVVCGSVFFKEPTLYKVPSMPLVIMPVGTRPPVVSTSGEEAGTHGDSLYASSRDVLAARNRFASIVANHADLMARQAMINYMDEQGTEIQSTVNVPGGIINLPMGHNKIEQSPMKEISATVVNMLGWLNDQVERGMLPNIDISKPYPSGTLYNLVQETSARVFNPQLSLLNNMYADMCRLIEEQMIAGKLEIKIEGQEKRKYFEVKVKPVDLKKPHTINAEFTARTPWSQMDTYQVALMARQANIPEEFINEYILKLPDPKGISDQNAIQMAESSPKLAMVRAIKALLKAGRLEEAAEVKRDYDMMVSQEMMNGQQMGQGTGQPAGGIAPTEGAL